MTVSGSTVATLVRPLELVAHGDVARDGAKGATLGGLLRAGLPVPGGFVVETAAYREFVATTNLHGSIADCLDGLDLDDPAACRQAAADIHVGIVATPLPADLSDAIADAYAGLSGPGPGATVAVRSSTSTPDTGSHMLAHLNDTFLCVRGAKAVLDAVRRCWASLYSERALLLRDELGFADAELDIAVVVQRQVAATRAGVLLTGPVGRAAEPRILVEASYALRDAEVRTLARLGVLVEDRLRAPQVVEWAIDRAGKAWILQSTPLSVGSTGPHP